jgi:archaellum component FlaC
MKANAAAQGVERRVDELEKEVSGLKDRVAKLEADVRTLAASRLTADQIDFFLKKYSHEYDRTVKRSE